ncbi:MAG: hypothetical protein ACPHRO_11415 [Nannocystaceae bacterium]
MSTPSYATDGPTVWQVLGPLFVVSALLGAFVYHRYAASETYVKEGILRMDATGASRSADECVDASLEWFNGCEANHTNAVVCEQGLKLVLFHCLKAAPRDEACQEYQGSPNGRWVYDVCESRGQRCINKRECACATVFRSFESFCLNDQERVQL